MDTDANTTPQDTPEYQVIEHLQEQLGRMQDAGMSMLYELEEKMEAARGLGLDPEKAFPDLGHYSSVFAPGFEDDTRVEVLTSGTGKLWPRAGHVRSGRVFKSGQTEHSYLVALDEPLGQDHVININGLELRELKDESSD